MVHKFTLSKFVHESKNLEGGSLFQNLYVELHPWNFMYFCITVETILPATLDVFMSSLHLFYFINITKSQKLNYAATLLALSYILHLRMQPISGTK